MLCGQNAWQLGHGVRCGGMLAVGARNPKQFAEDQKANAANYKRHAELARLENLQRIADRDVRKAAAKQENAAKKLAEKSKV